MAEFINKPPPEEATHGLTGEEKYISVLIARLPAFYSMAEGKSPLESTNLLNGCFKKVVPPILSHKGRVDQYVVSVVPAVVARFGAPIPIVERRIVEAVAAALEIGQIMKEASLPVTLTVNRGLAYVGNIGTEDRIQYTIVGPMVNEAFSMSARQKPDTIIVMGRKIEEDTEVLSLIQKSALAINLRPLWDEPGPAYQLTI